jgi:hypothetical protein
MLVKPALGRARVENLSRSPRTIRRRRGRVLVLATNSMRIAFHPANLRIYDGQR